MSIGRSSGVVTALAAGLVVILLVGGPLAFGSLLRVGGSTRASAVAASPDVKVVRAASADQVAQIPEAPPVDQLVPGFLPPGYKLADSYELPGPEGLPSRPVLVYQRGTGPGDPKFAMIDVWHFPGIVFSADEFVQDRSNVRRLTVRGHEAVMEVPENPAIGIWVLRWAERDELVIIVVGSGSVTEADLEAVANGLVEAGS